MEQRFSKKVVVVTGAAGDIGSAVCARFAREGANVVAVDFDAVAVETLCTELGNDGYSCLSVVADVTVESDVERYVQQACEVFGGIDALFNNAGVEGSYSDISECDMDDFDRVFSVNVRGVLLGMKHTVPVMRERGGGAIVNTASVAGISGAPGLTSYCASKHAVVGLTRSVAMQQGVNNIRVNAVCPSAMTGRMMNSIESQMQAGGADDVHQVLKSMVPMGRYANSDDVASMVTHLCSDEAAFLNGGIYPVDGGVTA
ncbi:MAG: 3alpha(or 20beta)-hydroxysteroid dehydrogenase [Halioglobus sp.]|jgi:3alpha(or 20beta)-hydroxysteroid dehydrogenase